MSSPTSDHGTANTETTEELAAQLELLQEENDRLRAEYKRAKKTTYRRTAIALAGIGALALLAAGLLPGVRELLIVLAAIGLFGGVLTFYLTPERVVTIDVGEAVYDAHHTAGNQLVDELGLTDTRIYVPIREEIRLFIPKHREYELPTEPTLFVTDDTATRGVTLRPTGETLATELDTTSAASTESSFATAIRQAGDAVVEQFEIADSVDITTSNGDGDTQLIVEIAGAAFGSLAKFDHPVVSLIGTAAAREVDTAVRVETKRQSNSFVATYKLVNNPPRESDSPPN